MLIEYFSYIKSEHRKFSTINMQPTYLRTIFKDNQFSLIAMPYAVIYMFEIAYGVRRNLGASFASPQFHLFVGSSGHIVVVRNPYSMRSKLCAVCLCDECTDFLEGWYIGTEAIAVLMTVKWPEIIWANPTCPKLQQKTAKLSLCSFILWCILKSECFIADYEIHSLDWTGEHHSLRCAQEQKLKSISHFVTYNLDT